MELTDFSPSLVIAVNEQSQVFEARRLARKLANHLEFDEIQGENVSIVATELASNLIKHAKGGELIIRGFEENGTYGLEMISVDRGPGLVDIEKSLLDGTSSTGTLGGGLGAVKRLSAIFDIVTSVETGTIIVSKIKSKKEITVKEKQDFNVGAICLPLEGETACGDNWMVAQSPGRCLVIVADGLGHGPLAAEASSEALRIFSENKKYGPSYIIDLASDALKKTRGSAVAIAEIDKIKKQVTYSGVGNIAGTIVESSLHRSLVSMNGTVGIGPSRAREYYYPWSEDSLLIMNSDGIQTTWRLDKFSGIARSEPSLSCAVLYKYWSRGRDDSTVVAIRQN